MRKFGILMAVSLVWAGWQALPTPPAEAELKVSITGDIRFNAIFSDLILGNRQTIPPGAVPFDSGPAANKELDNNETIIDARRTRFNIIATDTGPGNIQLRSHIQADFDTTDGNALVSNSRRLRLRLAYAQGTMPEGFTIRFGQVRTIMSEYGDNLIGGVGVPDVLDENGHFNQIQARQPSLQVAWTTKMAGGDLTIGAGVEQHAVNVKTRTGLSAAVDERQGSGQDVPLFGGGVRFRSPLFAVFARGAVAKSRVIFAGTGKDEDEGVWLGAIGVQVTPVPMITIVGQYHTTEGLSRINDTFFPDVALVAGKLETVEARGAHGGVQFKPAKTLRFNAIYEWMKADDDPKIFNLSSASSDKEKAQAFRVNVIYSFWTRWDTGVEYLHGEVDSFGASDGTLNVVNFRLRFYF